MIEVAVCEDSEIDRGMLEEIIGFLLILYFLMS